MGRSKGACQVCKRTFASRRMLYDRSAFGSRKRPLIPHPMLTARCFRNLHCQGCSSELLRTTHCVEGTQWVPVAATLPKRTNPNHSSLREVHLMTATSINEASERAHLLTATSITEASERAHSLTATCMTFDHRSTTWWVQGGYLHAGGVPMGGQSPHSRWVDLDRFGRFWPFWPFLELLAFLAVFGLFRDFVKKWKKLSKTVPKLSRLGELLNTQINVHIFVHPRDGGVHKVYRFGGYKGTPLLY